MSTQDLKTILETIKKFPYSFKIEKEVATLSVPDPKDKKKTKFEEKELQVLYVTYGKDKEGSFKLPLHFLKPDQKAKLLESLVKGENKIEGAIPLTALSKHIEEVKIIERDPKNYTLTKEILYVDRLCMQVQTENIQLEDCIQCKVVKLEKDHPERKYVLHPVLVKGHPGCGVIYKGYLFSGHVNGWKESGKDPLNLFIDKVNSIDEGKMKELFEEKIKGYKITAEKNAKKALPAPPVKVEPLTSKTVQKVYAEMMKHIKGEDIKVYESWAPCYFVRKWDGKDIVSIKFKVDGFIHSGIVSVAKQHSRGVYTVSLLEGTKEPLSIKKTIQGLSGHQVCQTIDNEIEFGMPISKYNKLYHDKYEAAKKEVKAKAKKVA